MKDTDGVDPAYYCFLGLDLTYYKYYDNGAENPTQHWYLINYFDLIKKVAIIEKQRKSNPCLQVQPIPVNYFRQLERREEKDTSRLDYLEGKLVLIIEHSFVCYGDRLETKAKYIFDLSNIYEKISIFWNNLSSSLPKGKCWDPVQIRKGHYSKYFRASDIADFAISEVISNIYEKEFNGVFVEASKAIASYTHQIGFALKLRDLFTENNSIVDYIEFNGLIIDLTGIHNSDGHYIVNDDDEAKELIEKISTFVNNHSQDIN